MGAGAEAEAIVVGGGPAGAATAIGLARRGRRVLLLEGRDFARRPVPRAAEMRSGEVLSPGSQRELRRLGLPLDGADWRFTPFATLHQRWPNGRRTLDRLPAGLEFWQTDRGRLDRALFALARAAGADARDGCRVRGVLREGRDGGRVCGVVDDAGRSWRAPVVVDAGGRHSALLVQLGLKRPEPEFQRIALVSFYASVEDCAPGVWEQHFLATGNTTLKGSLLRAGLYRFSLETDLAFRDRIAARQDRLTPHALTLAILRELDPPLHERFRAARPLDYSMAYAPVAYRVGSLVHDGLVLVGDATGYLDPATGQGIEFALRSGRLAAAAIERALAAGDCRRAQFAPYLAGRRRELARSVRWLRLYLRLSRRGPLLNLVGALPPARAALIRALVRPRPAAR